MKLQGDKLFALEDIFFAMLLYGPKQHLEIKKREDDYVDVILPPFTLSIIKA